MTKESLLSLIEQAIATGEKKQKPEEKYTFIYTKAITLLNRLKQKIMDNVLPEKPYNSSDSLGILQLKKLIYMIGIML